jgi:predicted NodU family carbamoyl transferase
MKKSTYVLGTGLSHDGSACLLKDGKVCVAIEKERLTRLKHDGGNDRLAVEYCLRAAGITIAEVDLVVQNANFGGFAFGNAYFKGDRSFDDATDVPVVTISHHLAHAYSAAGTCPFDRFNVLVMDGCGNAYDDCRDLPGAAIFDRGKAEALPHLYHEKDSYYRFSPDGCVPLVKDFSEWGHGFKSYPMHPNTTKHSIGGLYSAVSTYCFGNIDDPGKLMGLGPYGRPGVFSEEVFELRDGRVFVHYDWMEKYRKPARSYEAFKKDFQYYADIACGIQREVERAILYVVRSRQEAFPSDHFCYAGGTALNAVANARILAELPGKQVYVQPAAGDNGLSLGCAFYGWLEVLKREKAKHSGSTCFGITYPAAAIKAELEAYAPSVGPETMQQATELFFGFLDQKKRRVPGPPADLAFDIAGFGALRVRVDEKLECREQTPGRPGGTVQAALADFYQVLRQPHRLGELTRSGKIKVSDANELNVLLHNLDFEGFAALLQAELPGPPAGGVRYAFRDDYIRQTASLLAQGKVVAWFQDGCEFGPRALGRRSILADPRNPGIRNFINAEIKFREDFRPFAPSVLREDVSEYFETDRESPYMILVDYVKDAYRDTIRSVVHENKTSRIQTVTPEWNAKYYQLLQEFKNLTGMPMLLNTSFNRKGMPIVETPADALSFFFSCKLDYLVIGQFIVGKEEADLPDSWYTDTARPLPANHQPPAVSLA